MDKNLEYIQTVLINTIKRLDSETNDIETEVARSNGISQLANTYIKSCNLVIRVEESNDKVKNKLNSIQG